MKKIKLIALATLFALLPFAFASKASARIMVVSPVTARPIKFGLTKVSLDTPETAPVNTYLDSRLDVYNKSRYPRTIVGTYKVYGPAWGGGTWMHTVENGNVTWMECRYDYCVFTLKFDLNPKQVGTAITQINTSDRLGTYEWVEANFEGITVSSKIRVTPEVSLSR